MIQRRKNSTTSFAAGVRIRNIPRNSLALVLALGVSGTTACSRNDAPPRVEHLPIVFILVDALRPDHMGVYGFARDTTPALSLFRRDAVLFENAYAAAPKTVPSVPQTLTSSYFPDALPAPSLMKTVGDAGYRHTAAIVNNPYASKWIGRQQPTFASVLGEELSATEITDRALSWLESASDPRLLAYLHYLDTHTPYRPPATYAELFLDPVYDGPITDEFSDVAGAWAGRYQTVDQLRILDLYDATIRYTDEQLGRLFDGMRELDLYEDALIIVTSDHGEEFWDHGAFFHGQSLYDELLRVPLLIKFPRNWRAGSTVAAAVSTVDLLPTIAAAIGAAVNGQWVGHDLSALVASGATEGGRSFATVGRVDERRPPRHAFGDKRFKLIVNVADGSEELYDRATDPRETRNRIDEEPQTASRLREQLRAHTEPLWSHGYFMEISNPGEESAEYEILLSTDPPLPFVNPDRRDGEPGDRLAISAKADSFSLEGRIDAGDTDTLRFDLLGSSGELRLDAKLNGAQWPADGLLYGTGPPRLVQGRARILLDGEDLETIPPRASSAEPVLRLWRTPGASAVLAPSMSEEEVARLKALGYLN